MKYNKIKSLNQYNEYCDIHEKLMIEDEEKHFEEIELLEVLIEDYDRRLIKSKFEDLNPVELLKSILKESGLSQNKLAKEIGVSRQLISDILHYRRNISKEVNIKLSKHFSMSQEAFGRKYELKILKQQA